MSNKLIFCGEFKDGKRWNGKGYDGSNNIVYELKNGKGRVKEYNCGYLIFERDYLNGKKNEKGKEYDFRGKLKYEGEYLNGNKVSNKSC